MYQIDEKNRAIYIYDTEKTIPIIIKEYDRLQRKFEEGTSDKYECELVLLEVELRDLITQEETGEKEIRAFARRINYPQWLMEFDENEYIL
ncbi:hypothetical protein [Fusobacterium ulcerans]